MRATQIVVAVTSSPPDSPIARFEMHRAWLRLDLQELRANYILFHFLVGFSRVWIGRQ
jgi:hypothetical protein